MPTKLELIANHHLELAESAGSGDVGRLRGLLALGADVNAQGEDGRTPLFAAVAWRELESAQLLIAYGADPRARDVYGRAPLHMAAFYGDEAGIGLLIDHGAEVNARDADGWTPLHLAARIGRVEETVLLLSRGGDAAIRDQQGRMTLDVALDNSLVKDRWPALAQLLGQGNRPPGGGPARPDAEAAKPPLPTPADLGRDHAGPGAPGPDRGHSQVIPIPRQRL